MNRIFNYGSVNIDHVYRVAHVAAPGETIAAASYARASGGKGANQSVAAARAGATVFHIGRIGPDGDDERAALAAHGVHVDFLTAGEAPTGCATIQVADDGENAIVILGGANRGNDPADLERALAAARPGDLFLTQNETNGVPDALRQAKARGLATCLNPAPYAPEVKTYPLDQVDLLILNQTEIEGFTEDRAEPAIAVGKLQKRYPAMEIILTLGARGGYYASADHRFAFAAAPADAVDTTAAGDCFIGYLLAGRCRGLPIHRCLAWAAQAAAISVTRAGAIPSIPSREDVDNR